MPASRYAPAVSAPARSTLRLILRNMITHRSVHHRRLARLVAGDLRPELVGLEEHLADALVGSECLQRVEIEYLGNAGRHGHRGLVHGRTSPGSNSWATVYPIRRPAEDP